MRLTPGSVRDATCVVGATIVVIAVVIATVADPQLGLGLLAGVGFAAWSWRHPSAAGALWLTAVALVPQWWTAAIPGVGSVSITSLISVALGLTLLVSGAGRSKADVYVALFAALIVAALGLAIIVSPLQASIVRDFLLVWVIPAFIGARLAPSLRTTLPLVGAVVAAWAIFELVFDVHVFETLGQVSSWQTIQYRGGIPRSEAAFGTPLAMGAFLAITLPFVQYLRRGRALAAAVIVAGILTTVSRSPLIALLATIILIVYRYGNIRIVLGTTFALITTALIVAPLFASEDASADADGSNLYRMNALEGVIRTIRPFGLSEGAFPDPITGSLRFGGFNSIDSAILLTALVIGWVPVVLALIALIPVIVTVARRRASPEETALAGQIIMVITLAFITGWQVAFFVLVGIVMRARAERALSEDAFVGRRRPSRAGISAPIEGEPRSSSQNAGDATSSRSSRAGLPPGP